jgi:glycine C-acetyltransferase
MTLQSRTSHRLISHRRGGHAIIDGVDMIMLGSNDYLSLSLDERVISATRDALEVYGTGVGIYPVLATTELHVELCEALARYLGTEAAAVFSSGGTANTGVLTTLAQEGDVIISDRLNHASIIDGCRLSKADVVSYENRSVERLREALDNAGEKRRKLVITDGIFSMEGGAAPLQEIYRLTREYDALLVVDEAHATAVVGPQGMGTAPLCGLSNASPGLILTGSLSKALGGASGGFVAGSYDSIEELKSRSRSWIFTMGMTTANAATALEAVRIVSSDKDPLGQLWHNVEYLREAFKFYGLSFYESDSAITGLRVGDEDRACELAANLRAHGIFAPAISYPIVARGESRLRIQVSAGHTTSDIDKAASTLGELMNQYDRIDI